MTEITKEQAKELIRQEGSNQTKENPDVPFVTSIDKNNYVSSWVVVPASKAKINYQEVEKALDIVVSELKPNIPQTPTTFISKEQYDSLLSQSIDLNATINTLTNEVTTLNSRIGELETKTDSEISEKLSFQQTNTVLLNQLTTLSDTINGFGQQIASAVQKSVEESIYRTSLQAQNEGFKAQIQALISQADSLNAIITGLYGQLGAAQIQQEIENDAQSLSNALQGIVLNNVVITEEIIPTGGLPYLQGTVPYYYWANVRNDNGTFKWIAGGDLTFKNVNNLTANVSITISYPKKDSTSSTMQKFFNFETLSFSIPGKGTRTIKAIYTKDGVSGIYDYGFFNFRGQPKSETFATEGQISIAVNVEGFPSVSRALSVGMVLAHPNSF